MADNSRVAGLGSAATRDGSAGRLGDVRGKARDEARGEATALRRSAAPRRILGVGLPASGDFVLRMGISAALVGIVARFGEVPLAASPTHRTSSTLVWSCFGTCCRIWCCSPVSWDWAACSWAEDSRVRCSG